MLSRGSMDRIIYGKLQNGSASILIGWPGEGRCAIPWTGKSFASRHNKKLKGAVASKAAAQANAMLRSGVPEGEAIATANKHANLLNKRSRTIHSVARKLGH